METFSQRLSKLIKDHADGKHTVFAKKIGIPTGTFQSYVDGKLPKPEYLLLISEKINVSIDWLLTGKGDPYICKVGASQDDDTEFAEFLNMARVVLESGTAYSDTLIANIRLSHHAMETEKRLKGIEKRLGKIEKDKSCQEKLPRIRKGDNEAERDTILKNRVACVC